MKKLTNLFISTAEQKILNFLAQNSGKSFFDKEVAQKTRLSRGATNKALRDLAKSGLFIKEKKGRMNFYQANINNPLVKEFKVLRNVIQLFPLVKKLKRVSEKIILFGSASRGENYKDSDIDLFVLTHNKEEVKKIIRKSKRKLLQLIIKNPTEFVALEKRDPIFYQETTRGITLWEKYE